MRAHSVLQATASLTAFTSMAASSSRAGRRTAVRSRSRMGRTIGGSNDGTMKGRCYNDEDPVMVAPSASGRHCPANGRLAAPGTRTISRNSPSRRREGSRPDCACRSPGSLRHRSTLDADIRDMDQALGASAEHRGHAQRRTSCLVRRSRWHYGSIGTRSSRRRAPESECRSTAHNAGSRTGRRHRVCRCRSRGRW